MSLRQAFRKLLKRAGPIMYSTTFVFENPSESKEPTEDDKLKFDPVDIKKLTPEYMIQQSTVDAVNSATQALTVCYMTIIRTSNEYKVLLNELIVLLKDTLQFQVTDKHWDMIIDLRSKVQSKKDILNKLTGYVDYIHKMAVAASEMSYLSGLDNLSITLSQRIDDALKHIKDEANCIIMLEQEYCSVQEECIKKANKSDKPNESIDP